jgi:hypothetical protein
MGIWGTSMALSDWDVRGKSRTSSRQLAPAHIEATALWGWSPTPTIGGDFARSEQAAQVLATGAFLPTWRPLRKVTRYEVNAWTKSVRKCTAASGLYARPGPLTGSNVLVVMDWVVFKSKCVEQRPDIDAEAYTAASRLMSP